MNNYNDGNDIEESQDVKLLFDVFIQNMALQKLLIEKGIITSQEIQLSIDKETKLILEPFLVKAGVDRDKIDEILAVAIKNRDADF